jgi:hypothetical protein
LTSTIVDHYVHISICLLPSIDGGKLLVTASIRVDTLSVKLGPAITHFIPTSSTRIFLDCEAIDLFKAILADPSRGTQKIRQFVYVHMVDITMK